MGLTYVTVRLSPLVRRKKAIEENFLVDTGAIDCMVDASKLAKVGLKAEGTDLYELADGTTIELPYGFARVTFMGSETISKVIFGKRGTESLLGVVAPESTGIGVDRAEVEGALPDDEYEGTCSRRRCRGSCRYLSEARTKR